MGHSEQSSGKKWFWPDLFGKPDTLPVFLFILFFVILFAAGPELRSTKHTFEPPWLIFVLNTVFITVLCLLIAGLCFRSFLRGGFLNILLLGCGVLTFGLSSFVAGWLIRPLDSPNDAITIHNIGVICTSVFFFVSSLYTAFGISPDIGSRKRLVAVLAYTGVLATGTILTSAALLDLTPPFFIAGEGPTVIRQVVLAVSATLLTLSAVLMMTVYADRRSGFILYFVNALLLLGAGLAGVALGPPGSPLNWLGRAAQYLGIAYLAGASMKALGEARSKKTTIEKALADFFRKAETHYRALIEMAADAIVSIDRKGKIILINPAAEEIFGYCRDEAIGQNLAELIVPEQSRDPFYACLSGESQNDTGMALMRKDGSLFPAELSFSPEMKSDEGSERTIIIRDVTERRQAQEAVQSTALFPIQNPEPVLRIHRDGTLIFSNQAAEPVLAKWRAASGGGIPSWVSQHIDEALGDGVPRNFEVRIADRDFAFAVTPIVEGQYANLYGWDVTARKRAESALQESEERYRRLFEGMNEGFALYELLCDQSGRPCDYRFLAVNPAFERLTGLKRQDVVGRTVVEVMPGTEPDWIQRYGEVALTGAPAHFESRSSALNRDYEVSAYRTAPGQFAVIFLDVTKRKQAEEALLEAKEHLERRVRERTAELKAAALYARSLIEANLDPLVTINPEGRITDVNQATEQATGVPRDRLIGSDFSDYFTQPEAARAGYMKVFTEGQVRDYPLTIRNATGRLIDVLYHASIYRNEAGDAQGVFAAARDITELRKAETALKEANESLERRVSERTKALQHAKDYAETLIRTANVLIVGLDDAGNVQTFNDAAEKITGYTRAEMLGRNWFEVAVPRDRYPHVWDEFLRLQSCSFPSEFENPILTKDGRERVISWRNSEIHEGEQVRGTISFGRDVTDRKEAEESLRSSYELLKIAQRAANAGLWGWDISTGTLTWSEEFYNLFGLDPMTSASFDTWLGVLHPDDRQQAMEGINGSIRERTPLENEYRIIRPDGRQRWIRVWGSTSYDESSRPLRMSGVCIDVTESKRAEEALRRSEARYRSYIEVTGQVGWTTNADGEVVDDIPALRHYTGQTFDEMRGFGWSKAIHPDDVEITLAVWRKAVDEKQGYETEYRLRRHDGIYRYFLARGVPVLNEDGSVREWVGTCIDITERRGQEEELRKLNRTLRALSRSNEALMRAEEELAFLEEVCRIVVQDCGYAMVWIGYACDDEDRSVRPVAHAGFSGGYLETLTLTWADREQGRGPTGTSIRTGKPILCTDMLTDPRFEPWRDEALKRGYASSLALPLLDAGRAFGAVTIYSTQPESFSEEEIELLSEMADDLTYGIASLRLRMQSRQTLQALQESEARFRLLSGTAGRLLSTEDPQDLIEELCRGVMEHLDCHAFFNFMVDENAGKLRLNACAGIPDEEVRKLEWLDYGVGVCGCVARDKTRIVAEDIFHTPDVRTELVRSYGIQAYCCHSLKAQDRLIGTLSFGTKTRARFTPEEVELMRTVADQVAVAMQRLQAQQELRASEEALRLANEQLEQRVRERTTELILLLEDLEKSRNDLRKLASELVMAEERERKKISVLLHDEVAQALAATKMRLDLLRSVPGNDEFRAAVSEAQELLGQSIRQTRALMTDISNPVLYDMGLQVAVEALAEEVNARQGIAVSCSFGGRLRNLGQDMEVLIFQVVKELVQNIVKHSRARNAGIRLVEEKNAVRAVVTDDGQGFDTGMIGTVQSEGGFGLFSIRERVKSYGGSIHIKSGPGRGSEVSVNLPKGAAGNTASLKARNGKKGA